LKYKLPKKFSIKSARYAQNQIAKKIEEKDCFLEKEIRYAAGVDLAYIDDTVIGSAVIVEKNTFKVIEKEFALTKVTFPYIPTLLAFREVYPAWKALKKLKQKFDILFVDGNGKLHPFRAGFACQLGLIIDKPTIGIAKKLLCGNQGKWKNNIAPIFDKNDIIGYALKTSAKANPIYVSVGHKISLQTAVKLTLTFTKDNLKLPEPIRQAHIFANSIRRRYKNI